MKAVKDRTGKRSGYAEARDDTWRQTGLLLDEVQPFARRLASLQTGCYTIQIRKENADKTARKQARNNRTPQAGNIGALGI